MLIAINLYIFKSNYKNEYGLYWVFVEPNQSCKRMPQIHQVILLLIPITWFSIAKESKINNIRVLWAVLTISPTQKEGSWSVGAYKWLIHIGAGSSVPGSLVMCQGDKMERLLLSRLKISLLSWDLNAWLRSQLVMSCGITVIWVPVGPASCSNLDTGFDLEGLWREPMAMRKGTDYMLYGSHLWHWDE